MADPLTLTRGDECPNCGGELKDARVPTDEQRAAAHRREDPVYLPDGYDTASVDFRKEHGGLARCRTCGYQTRFPLEPEAPKKKKDAA